MWTFCYLHPVLYIAAFAAGITPINDTLRSNALLIIDTSTLAPWFLTKLARCGMLSNPHPLHQ